MAMLDLGNLKVAIQLDATQANTNLDDFNSKLGKSGQEATVQWDKVGSSLSRIGGNMTKYLTLPLLAMATASVKLASDLDETMNKVNTIFGGSSGAVEQWATGSINSMGLAKQSALDMVATFGDLGSSMGLTTAENIKMSTALVQTASDLASFKNISIERAQSALMGIYTGETEALKSLGVVMTEANLEQFAMAEGLSKTYKEMTQTEKTMLRYQYVVKATSNAQGDFAKTGGSTANQSRMITENLKELGAQFGAVLAPAINQALQTINGFLQGLQSLTPEQQKVIAVVALTVASIGPLLSAFGSLITTVQAVSTAMVALNISTGGVLAIVGLVATAIGLLGASLLTSSSHAEQTTEKMDTLGKILNTTKEEADGLGQSIEEMPDNKDISINANTETAQTNVTNLSTDVDNLQKLDRNLLLTVDTTDAQANVQGLASAVVGLLDENGPFRKEAKEMKGTIDEITNDLIGLHQNATGTYLILVKTWFQSGQITMEQAVSLGKSAIAQHKEYADSVKNDSNAMKEVITSNSDESLKVFFGMGDGINYAGSSAKNAKEGFQELEYVLKNNVGGADGAKQSADNFSKLLDKEATDSANKYRDAVHSYNEKLKEARDASNEAKTAVDEAIPVRQKEAEALAYLTNIIGTGVDKYTALQMAEEKFGKETMDSVKTALDEKGGIYELSYDDLYTMAQQHFDDVKALQAEKNGGYMTIEQEYNDKREELQQELADNVLAINQSFTKEDLDNYKKYCADNGIVLDQHALNILDTMSEMQEGIRSGQKNAYDIMDTELDVLIESYDLKYKNEVDGIKKDAEVGFTAIGVAMSGGILIVFPLSK